MGGGLRLGDRQEAAVSSENWSNVSSTVYDDNDVLMITAIGNSQEVYGATIIETVSFLKSQNNGASNGSVNFSIAVSESTGGNNYEIKFRFVSNVLHVEKDSNNAPNSRVSVWKIGTAS